MALDPEVAATLATPAALAATTDGVVLTSVTETVQVDTRSSSPCAAPSTPSRRSVNEIMAAEALCALNTATRPPFQHREKVSTRRDCS
jgi:hypothetical protein